PDNGTQGGMSLYRNLGNGKFEDATKRAGLEKYSEAFSCTSGDYDNDGYADLAVAARDFGILLLHNEKSGTFKSLTAESGITFESHASSPGTIVSGLAEPMGLTYVDYDHDGDLDLYVTEILPGITP